MPPLSHLTSRTPTKYNLFANSLAAAVSEPALYRLLTFHVPNLMSLFHCLGCTKASVQARGKCLCFITKPVFTVRCCLHLTQTPDWRTTPCRLSTTAYSIYSQLPSLLEVFPPSATWGRTMPWWRGLTHHRCNATHAWNPLYTVQGSTTLQYFSSKLAWH